MEDNVHRAMAIVGVGAVLPDAPNAPAFWENVKHGRYSISEVPPERWNPALYYDPNPTAPDKTYSKIGGWVKEHVWDPMKWRLPIPPRVSAAMDQTQQWAIECTREALEDYGYPKRPLDLERTAVILGNAMGGEKHYFTVMRVLFPEFARELAEGESFAALPDAVQKTILDEVHGRMNHLCPEITEDTMPGELSNCVAGRIANLFHATAGWSQITVPTLSVGPIVAEHVSGWSGAMGTSELWRLGPRHDGLLGPAFFARRRVTFDWAKHELVFEDD